MAPMPRPPRGALGLLARLLPVHYALAGRTKGQKSQFEVDLLVTRHALSCANVVSDWKAEGQVSFANRRVPDPVLTYAGAVGSRSEGETMRKTMSTPPDAVLSSVLVRAIETALFQYPRHRVNVVPHIREGGSGMLASMFSTVVPDLDNQPVAWEKQYVKLENALKEHPDFEAAPVDASSWVQGENLRTGEGSWDKFVGFLGSTFLPHFIPQMNKTRGDGPIVLAVVTHSLFMKDAKDIKGMCKHFWKSHPGGKPLNNQVVKIRYTAFKRNDKYDVKLNNAVKCVQVAAGVPYKGGDGKTRPICRDDIGQVCLQDLSNAEVKEPTLEARIEAIETRAADYEDKLQHFTSIVPGPAIQTMTPEERKQSLTKQKESAEAKVVTLQQMQKDRQCLVTVP